MSGIFCKSWHDDECDLAMALLAFWSYLNFRDLPGSCLVEFMAKRLRFILPWRVRSGPDILFYWKLSSAFLGCFFRLRGGLAFLTTEIFIGLSTDWYFIAPTTVLFLKNLVSLSLSWPPGFWCIKWGGLISVWVAWKRSLWLVLLKEPFGSCRVKLNLIGVDDASLSWSKLLLLA